LIGFASIVLLAIVSWVGRDSVELGKFFAWRLFVLSPRVRSKEEVALRSDLLSRIKKINNFVLTGIGAIGQSGSIE
jgi:hypothetical protein